PRLTRCLHDAQRLAVQCPAEDAGRYDHYGYVAPVVLPHGALHTPPFSIHHPAAAVIATITAPTAILEMTVLSSLLPLAQSLSFAALMVCFSFLRYFKRLPTRP